MPATGRGAARRTRGSQDATDNLSDLRAAVAVLTARDSQRGDELAALRVEVGGLKVALHLQAHDRDWLQTVANVMRQQSFSAQDLLARAELQPALAGMSARTIGARLKRLSRSPLPGFTLTWTKRDGPGCIWSLIQDAHCDRSAAAV
jgi:hypothetical protein